MKNHRGSHAHDCYETSGDNGLIQEKNKEVFFENHSVMVNNILPDDDANEAFNKIDRNIAVVDWEVESPEQEIQ